MTGPVEFTIVRYPHPHAEGVMVIDTYDANGNWVATRNAPMQPWQRAEIEATWRTDWSAAKRGSAAGNRG
jgi:hypothetical protein